MSDIVANPALELESIEDQTARLAAEDAVARRAARRRYRWLRVLSVALLIGFWQLMSMVIPYEAVVSPADTLRELWDELTEGDLLPALAITLQRVIECFALAMVIGTLLGILIGAYKTVNALLSVWVIVLITVPGLIYLVVGYVAFGIQGDTGAIFAVTLMVTPTVLVSIIQGTQALDRKLIEMARSYGRGRVTVVRSVVIPQLLPFIFGAARYALALTWHMVVFAEVIGRPNGIGFQIYFNYQIVNIAGIWAYGLTFVLVALFIEFAVLGNLQRYVFRWRQEATL